MLVPVLHAKLAAHIRLFLYEHMCLAASVKHRNKYVLTKECALMRKVPLTTQVYDMLCALTGTIASDMNRSVWAWYGMVHRKNVFRK